MSAITRHIVSLPGCTPEPLMNYLKALGLLRIIDQQSIAGSVRASWEDGIFTLTCDLSADELISEVCQRYSPTPVLSPWNGEGGFLADSGATFESIAAIEKAPSARFDPLRSVIASVRKIDGLKAFGSARDEAKELEKKKKKSTLNAVEKERLKNAKTAVKSLKESIVYQVRSQFPEESLAWLDACMVVGTDGFKAAPLLGSGGVDGRMEFSANFLANALTVVTDPRSKAWLRAALLETNDERLVSTSIGQFAPGRIGGPNATQGMEGASMINPWDFVLMIEGSLLLAGASSRKMGARSGGSASFPFTVRPSPAGMETFVESDGVNGRGELWLPLWSRPASLAELQTLFSEGRAEINGRQARDGVEFARAVAGLGIDRGIKAFSRHGFLKRNGLAFLATPLGTFEVRHRSESDLIRELDVWLGTMRRSCGEKTPARFRSALRQIECAIFDYCQHGGTGMFQRILITLGRVEAIIASAPRFREDAKGLRPIATLSSAWIAAADDHSDEFRIALALASIFEPEPKVGSIRRNLEPVEAKGRFMAWAEKDRAVVWTVGDLPGNLAAILTRRAMDAERTGGNAHALKSSHHAPLSAVCGFLAGSLDESLIADLLWGLCLCDSREYRPIRQEISNSQPLSSSYSLLKLLFLPPERDSSTDEAKAPNAPDARILALLRANRLAEACQRAAQVLRGRRILAQPQAMHGHPGRDGEWAETRWPGLTADRLAAALLIPIHPLAADSLKTRTLRPAKPETV
jgi:CRISPR-associated protein Csx17